MRPAPPSLPIVYRQTIRYSASGERKYIRYYDGRGHFGHVQLQLIPHPGELCSVSIDAACPLPQEASHAARAALFQRFDHRRLGLPPFIGFEVLLTGGAYLPRHSYPGACAIAATMAFDEALLRAGLFIVELYVGIRLLVELDALSWTMKTLADLLGEVRTTHTVTDIVRLDVEIPVRLYGAVKAALRLPVLDMFPLDKDMQYRPFRMEAGISGSSGHDLDEWT